MFSGQRLSKSAAIIVFFPALLSLIALFSKPVSAGVGFQPVNPEELKMTSEPQAPGAPAIILFREVDRDDDRYRPHEDNYLRIKILTEEGRKNADVEIVFEKGFETIVGIHARTIKPDGTIVEFDGKTFEKTIVKGRSRSYLVKTFTLPNVEVGSIIEYYYTIDFKELYVFESHWILSQELFTRDAKFSLKPYTSSYNEFHLRWTWQQLPAGAEPKEGVRGVIECKHITSRRSRLRTSCLPRMS